MASKSASKATRNGTNGRSPGSVPMPTRNDLPAKVREQMCALLNAQLADTFVVSSHAKQAHWNVRGPHFFPLHKLFDEVHEVIDGYVDIIAERITALGGTAFGTVQMAAGSTRVDEYPIEIQNGMDHVRALADRISALGATTRKCIEVGMDAGDEATADIFIDMVRDLDKYLWFVEAHLREG